MLLDSFAQLDFLGMPLFGVEFGAQAVELLGILGLFVTFTGEAFSSGEKGEGVRWVGLWAGCLGGRFLLPLIVVQSGRVKVVSTISSRVILVGLELRTSFRTVSAIARYT